MSEEFTGNILIVQDGEPTATINSALAGAVTEALNHGDIEEIYGALNGLRGVMSEDLIDLAEESQQAIRGLRYTPGAALGVSRGAVKRPEELERVLSVLQAHNITFLLLIGDRETQEAGASLVALAESQGYALRLVGLPSSLSNELSLTDHCPGYGSVAKLVASVAKSIAFDAASHGNHDLVSILEVGGGHTGWIAAAASLAKRRNELGDPPHLILMPEVAFDADAFIEHVRTVLKSHTYCQVVVGAGLVDGDGNYAATSIASEAASISGILGTSEYLKSLIEQHLAVKVETTELGPLQRCAAQVASKTDSDEAFLTGQSAVKAVVSGTTGKMITLSRTESDSYGCETGFAELGDVANSAKAFPANWINEDGVSVSYQYYKYASPLASGSVEVPSENGVLNYVTLSTNRVNKVLEASSMA